MANQEKWALPCPTSCSLEAKFPNSMIVQQSPLTLDSYICLKKLSTHAIVLYVVLVLIVVAFDFYVMAIRKIVCFSLSAPKLANEWRKHFAFTYRLVFRLSPLDEIRKPQFFRRAPVEKKFLCMPLNEILLMLNAFLFNLLLCISIATTISAWLTWFVLGIVCCVNTHWIRFIFFVRKISAFKCRCLFK